MVHYNENNENEVAAAWRRLIASQIRERSSQFPWQSTGATDALQVRREQFVS
jgi:hypothetical protein